MNWAALAWLSGAVWAVSAVLLLALGPGAPTAVVAAGGLSICLALGCGLAASRQRRRRDDKLSAELTALSERLLRLEAQMRSARSRADLDGDADGSQSGLAADVEVLGRLVTDLATMLDRQGEEVAAMRGELGRVSSRPPPLRDGRDREASPRPAAALEPDVDLSSRDGFVRSAAAILQRLSPGANMPAPSAPRSDRAAAIYAPTSTEAVLSALAQGRVECLVQPVVTLPQRRMRFFLVEPQLRLGPNGGPGDLVPTREVASVIRRHAVAPVLDREVMPRSFDVARRLAERGSAISVLCPVEVASLRDGGFLDEVERLALARPAVAQHATLAISTHGLAGAAPEVDAAVARLGRLGLGFALLDVADLATDWAALARRGFTIAAVDAARLVDPGRREAASNTAAETARSGILLVASGVAREVDIPDLIDLDVPFAQGPAFGAARPVRAELADAANGSPRPLSGSPPPGPDGPRSLRDVIRRAG